MSQNYYAEGAVHNDQHKEINITGNVTGSTLSRLMQSFMADAVEAVEEGAAAADPSTPEETPSAEAGDRLCVVLNSRQRAILDRAEQQGIIRYNPTRRGYDKGETSTQVLVAYLCGRLFCGDKVRRDEAGEDVWVMGRNLEEAQHCQQLFGFDVANTRRHRKDKTPPAGHERVDAIFRDLDAPHSKR